MRPQSPFHRFDTDRNCIVNVLNVERDPLPGTGGQIQIPKPKTLEVVFHVQGGTRNWPQIISGDIANYSIFLCTADLAEEIRAASFTGIEFYPVEFRFGDLRGLKEKRNSCPLYMWARIFGIVLVDLFVEGCRVPLDPTGKIRLEKQDRRKFCDLWIRPDQPDAADFARVVPASIPNPVISDRVAEFFDQKKIKELRIGAFGYGWL